MRQLLVACLVALAPGRQPPARDYRYCGRGCKYDKSIDLVYVHVPKTGGATARAALANCSGVFVEYANHVLGVARVLRLGRNATLALREPADRVVSEWHWSKDELGRDARLSDRAWALADAPALLAHAAKRLAPMHPFFDDVAEDDARVRVLCTERLAADLGALARDRGCAASVPRLHRTAASATSHHDMTAELRAELRRAYARDAALHDHYCTP